MYHTYATQIPKRKGQRLTQNPIVLEDVLHSHSQVFHLHVEAERVDVQIIQTVFHTCTDRAFHNGVDVLCKTKKFAVAVLRVFVGEFTEQAVESSVAASRQDYQDTAALVSGVDAQFGNFDFGFEGFAVFTQSGKQEKVVVTQKRININIAKKV